MLINIVSSENVLYLNCVIVLSVEQTDSISAHACVYVCVRMH